MKVQSVRLHRVGLPLVSPFRTSFGVQTHRDVLLLELRGPQTTGWGECVAMSDPLYSSEYVDACADVLRRFLLPALASAGDITPLQIAEVPRPFRGHRMAKAAAEIAFIDAYLRERDESLAEFLGADRERVPAGVSVGIMDSIPQLLEAVEGYLDHGY